MAEFLITSSLLIGAVILLRSLTRNRLSALLRYTLWLLVLIRLVIPFSLAESPLSIMNAFGSSPVNLQTAPDSAPALNPQDMQEPFMPAPSEALHSGDAISIQPRQDAQPKVAVSPKRLLRTILFWAWGIGAAAIGGWFLLVNLRFNRKLKLDAVSLQENQYRLPVYVTANDQTPCLAGTFYPAVYLPIHVAEDERMLRHSVTHELCHYSHGDHIWAWIRIACVSFYWFHPLVWVAAILSKRDCELACDEAVIKKLGGNERIAYGDTLLKLTSEPSMRNPLLRPATTMYAGKRQLRERIACISKPYRRNPFCILLTSVACVFMVGCAMTGAVTIPNEPSSQIMLENKPASAPLSEDIPLNQPTSLPYEAEQGELIAAFETIFSQSNDDQQIQNRCLNIEKAANLLDQRVVQPGETFSFNEAVGPRTTENGWRSALSIVNDASYVLVPGGGIDQVSTTLYNALLRANLPITERKANSTPSSYVERGLDATVDYNGIDLKFFNDTQTPIHITARVLNGPNKERQQTLRIEIYGTPLPDGVEYRLRSVVTKEEAAPEGTLYQDDPSLPQGMEAFRSLAHGGYEVEIYRDFYQDDVWMDSQLLYSDHYKSSPEIRRRGTKPPYLLTDMTVEELSNLAKSLYTNHRYESRIHSFDEANSHYAALFRELEMDCGGVLRDEDGTISFTLGVPMTEFEQAKCYPYAAIIFALDADLGHLDIGSMEYDRSGKDRLSLRRADVEAYYASVLRQPLLEYSKSAAMIEELLVSVV